MRLLVFLLLLFTLAHLAVAQTSTIALTIEGIQNTNGKIQIGLYNQKSDFGSYDKVFIGVVATPLLNKITYTFKDIPDGTYAIATWHDTNDNKKIDKNYFGIPTEKYGFSLNKYGTFGPPDFEDVSFKIGNAENVKLTIRLK
ncbi:MAG: DUF2141 domain-containing protein [Bacteroidetes bacterium]|nr:DUF2141 domain-containing protein [Bacteroidota bacterium]